jgi:hypothetical protein
MDVMELRDVTRRQVAREELDAAVELIFRGSIISANVLAWAALDVLRGVAKSRSIATFHDGMELMVRPEKLSEWRRALRSHYTFAKHSDKDPDAVIEKFNELPVEFVAYAASEDYFAIYGQYTVAMLLFKAWFSKRNIELLTEAGRVFAEPLFAMSAISDRRSAHQLLAFAKGDGTEIIAALPLDARGRIETY